MYIAPIKIHLQYISYIIIIHILPRNHQSSVENINLSILYYILINFSPLKQLPVYFILFLILFRFYRQIET